MKDFFRPGFEVVEFEKYWELRQKSGWKSPWEYAKEGLEFGEVGKLKGVRYLLANDLRRKERREREVRQTIRR